jgi:hypothetical protein
VSASTIFIREGTRAEICGRGLYILDDRSYDSDVILLASDATSADFRPFMDEVVRLYAELVESEATGGAAA